MTQLQEDTLPAALLEIAGLREQLEAMRKELSFTKAQLADKANTRTEHLDAIEATASLQREVADLRTQLAAVTKERDIAAYRQKWMQEEWALRGVTVERLTSERDAALAKVAELQSEHATIMQARHADRIRLSVVEAERDELKTRLATTEASFAQARDAITATVEEVVSRMASERDAFIAMEVEQRARAIAAESRVRALTAALEKARDANAELQEHVLDLTAVLEDIRRIVRMSPHSVSDLTIQRAIDAALAKTEGVTHGR